MVFDPGPARGVQGQTGHSTADAVAHLRAADPKLADLIARVGPCTLEVRPAASLFAALLRAIVHQQLHGRAAATIYARVQAVLEAHGGITAAALELASDEALRRAGLSRNKLRAVRDLAARDRAGELPSLEEAHALGDDELVARLTRVRGIGPWTVHMLLLFTLGRPDVMPTGDFAIRLAFRRLYRRRTAPDAAALLRLTRHWRPYRSVACWYLWRSGETVN